MEKKMSVKKIIEILEDDVLGMRDSDGDINEKEDISDKKTMKALIKYTIKDDVSENPTGDSGDKSLLLDEDTINSLATYMWNHIIEQLDKDFYEAKKAGTTMKFFLDAEITLRPTEDMKSVKIFFDVTPDGFKMVGWSFNVDIETDDENLSKLDKRLFKWIESSIPMAAKK